MQLQKRTQYAIRILIYIANDDKPLSIAKEISKTLSIPHKFLTKIMTILVKADFIISVRGKYGGYKLARDASKITIIEILNEFNECTSLKMCVLGTGACNPLNKCSLHNQWMKPKSMIFKMFKETTLDTLDDRDYQKENPALTSG